jgi:hypothetical protein
MSNTIQPISRSVFEYLTSPAVKKNKNKDGYFFPSWYDMTSISVMIADDDYSSDDDELSKEETEYNTDDYTEDYDEDDEINTEDDIGETL